MQATCPDADTGSWASSDAGLPIFSHQDGGTWMTVDGSFVEAIDTEYDTDDSAD